MRAGELRERITFLEVVQTQGESGAPRKEYVPLKTVRAQRLKQNYAAGSGLNAKEEFIGLTITFKVRRYPFINESLQVKYAGNRYKMVSPPDRNFSDNSLTITLTKVNK